VDGDARLRARQGVDHADHSLPEPGPPLLLRLVLTRWKQLRVRHQGLALIQSFPLVLDFSNVEG